MSTDLSTRFDASTRRPIEGAKNRTEGHLWLHRLVGNWTYETEMSMPDGGNETITGTETVRKLGEYWIVTDGVGAMPDDGTEGRMLITVGYDIAKRRFVGSWVGSMMENLWVYEGEMSEDGETLNLTTQGPDMMDEGKTVTYRDAMTLHGEDARTFTSSVEMPDGTWLTLMTTRYQRAN